MGRLQFSPDDPDFARSTEADFDGPPPAYHEVAQSSTYCESGSISLAFPMPAPAHYPNTPEPQLAHIDPFPLPDPPRGSAQSPQFTQHVSPTGQTPFSHQQGLSPQGWGQTQSTYAPLHHSDTVGTSASGSHARLNYAPSVRSTSGRLSPSASSVTSPVSPGLNDTASLASSSDAQSKDSGAASDDVLARILSHPPPCFSRRPPPESPYGPFSPSALLGVGSRLEKGFPNVPPPSVAIPHPFVTHDVSQEDWVLFLHHVKTIAKYAPVTGKLATELAPRAMGIMLMAGWIVTKGVKMTMKGKKKGPVAQLIAQWNHYFFHPRQVDIVLAQGRMSYTGADEIPRTCVAKANPPGKLLRRKMRTSLTPILSVATMKNYRRNHRKCHEGTHSVTC
ncbi:hypothetical protein OBBRIDRAFT_883961 [Obba rivulosa]|uniref:Uncharacterized protein n=1 Tax=Obba rivulosa TaxID=1052685 RepID=A0A8E2DTH5_9APHY|nr:hypothetical protein OBBRIDRAFT_883961 [Obba rivulosa]